MEKDTICGFEAHEHTDACYAVELIEPQPEIECIEEERIEDGVIFVHEHDEYCYDYNGKRICSLREVEEHVHNEFCYAEDRTLLCTEQEDLGHSHEGTCYVYHRGELICGSEEFEGHAHGRDCYETYETLSCTQSEVPHVHNSSCYDTIETLQCGLAEDENHTHDVSCWYAEETLTCSLSEETHVHDSDCYTLDERLICAVSEVEGHAHIDDCYLWTEELTCPQEERPAGHIHEDACYFIEMVLACTEKEIVLHEHGEECVAPLSDWTSFDENALYDEFGQPIALDEIEYDANGEPLQTLCELICELPVVMEHQHTAECIIEPEGEPYENISLVCGLEEHIHTDACYPAEPEYICGLTEHSHAEDCWDTEGNLICVETEHVHDETCLPTEESIYTCEKEEHVHTSLCLSSAGLPACGLEEHTHDETCGIAAEAPVVPTYACGIPAHAHTALCQDETGELICGLEAHEHTDECIDERILDIISKIDALPSADEIDATMLEYENAEDYDGLEEWYTDICIQISEVYFDYTYLSEEQKVMVSNADKLLELEYIWSAQNLIEDIKSDTPTAIKSASTKDFIELNLYDYNGSINTNYNSDEDWPGFQWNGGAYHKSGDTYNRNLIDFIDFGNSMITNFSYAGSNNGKSTTAMNIGRQGGAINEIIQYPTGDWANKPVGMSTGADVLARELGSDGYPQVLNAGSMKDYFSESSFADKKNTSTIDGLFQLDETTGEYYYNSRWNHAQYSNNKFTLYEDIITPNFITYPFGNFLPFNTITDSSKATQVSKVEKVGTYLQEVINDLWYASDYSSNATKQQLVAMLGKYRYNLRGDDDTTNATDPWAIWSAKDAILDYIVGGPTDDSGPITNALLDKMYNIDFDVETNFFFGMEMKMNFMQPKNGLTGKTGKEEMVFYFTGDDDVWVYIDGALFLDLSGIHRHVGGEIDFVNGKVHYYHLAPETGDVSTTPYATYTFAELLTAAGKSTDGLNSKGTFKDYSTHSFNFYYMERGSGSSVCRINFNFPLLKKNSVTVTKENVLYETNPETGKQEEVNLTVLGSPDYYFNIVKPTGGLLVGANTNYKLLDAAGNEIGTSTTDEFGIFKLKSGQTALFEGITENAGMYYVQELIKDPDHAQYNDTVNINGTASRYNSKIDWSARTWADPILDERYGSDRDPYIGPEGVVWWGYSSQDTNADASHTFNFSALNGVKTDQLGKLSIAKTVSDYNPLARGILPQFTMHVLLAGTEVPKGTPYTITYADGSTATDTVKTAGLVTVPAGATVTIENILSGTTFEIWEDDVSAAGYTVSYKLNGSNVSGNKVTGVINSESMNAEHTVCVEVQNSEGGATATIPVTKNLVNADSNARTFTFRLVEVTDATGATEVESTEQLLPIELQANIGTVSDSFTLVYPAPDYPENKTVYYKITENVAENDSSAITYDQTVWIVSIEVTRNTDGTVTAGTPMIVSPTGETAVVFTNSVTRYELPETGGMGTTQLYTLGGVLLMTATLLLYKKYRRKGGASSA